MVKKSIMVRVDGEIHEKIKKLAKDDKRSMGNYIAKILEDRVKKMDRINNV